jgi:hypothetical protein
MGTLTSLQTNWVDSQEVLVYIINEIKMIYNYISIFLRIKSNKMVILCDVISVVAVLCLKYIILLWLYLIRKLSIKIIAISIQT